MRSIRTIVVVTSVVASLAVTGCSGLWGSPPESAPPAAGGTFETLEDPRVAVERTGFQCAKLELPNQAKYASTSGYCGEIGRALYPNHVSLDAQLGMKTPQTQTAVNVGKNWTVTTAAPDQVREWLGGTMFPPASSLLLDAH